MDDKGLKDIVANLRQVLAAGKKMEEDRVKTEQEAREQQDLNARQSQVADAQPTVIYVSWDGDSIGNAVARAENKDDVDGLSQISGKIEAANEAARNWFIQRNGRIIESGGDEGLAECPGSLMPELETMRESYKRASGYNCTVGVGDKISRATRARMLGKLTGKNKLVIWDESTDRELEARVKADGEQTEGEKVADAMQEQPMKKADKEELSKPKSLKKSIGTFHPWIGVDLDGTLAHHEEAQEHIGAPIPKMLERVKDWHAKGYTVKIFTARAYDEHNKGHIQDWLEQHGLPRLEVTNVKDPGMHALWDDRAVSVMRNTGEVDHNVMQKAELSLPAKKEEAPPSPPATTVPGSDLDEEQAPTPKVPKWGMPPAPGAQ